MFYERDVDNALRFGDVIRGYVATTPCIEEPVLATEGLDEGYHVDIRVPRFSVILTPCCSIGEKRILLTPLLHVHGSFFDNPYFLEDLTGINRKMEPRQTVAPHVWEEFPREEREKRLEEGFAFTLLDFFIYEENDVLPRYTVHRRNRNLETGHYMIDIRNTYRLNCDSINRPQDAPLESKCLQLSIQTRSELREKISFYYGRPPKEDLVMED